MRQECPLQGQFAGQIEFRWAGFVTHVLLIVLFPEAISYPQEPFNGDSIALRIAWQSETCDLSALSPLNIGTRIVGTTKG